MFNLFNLIIFTCVPSYINHQDHCWNNNELLFKWNLHQQLISKVFSYYIQGNIVIHAIDLQNKKYIRFIWFQKDNNTFNLKLLNTFGITLMVFSIKNGSIYFSGKITDFKDDYPNKIKKWFLDDIYMVAEQLKKWIIGLPGYNTKYTLNSIGCLSTVNYCYNDKNISIYYHHYFNRKKPILPKIIEVLYDQYRIQLTINSWHIIQ